MKIKSSQRKWNDAERREFSESRLRATRIPNKKRLASRDACRKKVYDF